MATIIRVSGADFSANPVGFMPPVSDALQAWHYLGGDLTRSSRNLAPGGSNASVVGSPTVETSHLRLGAGAYLQTAASHAGEVTLFGVAKMPAGWTFASTAIGYVLSAYNSNGTFIGLRKHGSLAEPKAVPRAIMYRTIGGVPTYQALDGGTVSDASIWQFYSLRASNSSATVTNKTTGVSGTSATAGTLIGSGVPFRIGSSPGGVVSTIDVSFAAVYGRALTTTEETAVYTAVKAYMSRRFSITV